MTKATRYEEWQRRIMDFEQRGKSMLRWCREQEISYERMKYWRSRSKNKRLAVIDNGTKEASSPWVQVTDAGRTIAMQGSANRRSLLLHYREIVLEVPAGFDVSALRDVLAAVRTTW